MAFFTAEQAAEKYMDATYGDVANAISSASREGEMETTVPLKTAAHEYDAAKIKRELVPHLESIGYYATVNGNDIYISWADQCILNRYANL